MKVKRNRSMIPVYRESGYTRMLPSISAVEKWLRVAAILLLFVSGVLLLVARSDIRWTEIYYSLGFYPLWTGIISLVAQWLPFSLGEWVLVVFILFMLALKVHFIYQLVSYKRQWGRVVGRFAMRLLSIGSLVLLLFLLGGGLNYYRYRFADYTDLDLRPGEPGELISLCTELSDTANKQRVGLTENEAGMATYADSSVWKLGAKAPESYKALVVGDDQMAALLRPATVNRPKPVVFSEFMSYMNIVGVYFPFTVEANISTHTSDYTIPAAMCHELAHVAGFMREDEVNFIAYLACRASSDSLYRYSGTMLALIHSTNALYAVDKEAYDTVMAGLNDRVQRDIQLDAAYWEKYETLFGDFSTAVNDSYLKVNDQPAGVASYGQMVDLLLADRRRTAAE